MQRYIIRSILFVICFFAVERFCHEKTHGFSLRKIQAHLEAESNTNAFTETDDIRKILSQPFYFLNSGGECYCFVSGDGKTVLKFFKMHHLSPFKIEDLFLPTFIKNHYRGKRREKKEAFFTSCSLAWNHFRERSGLIYLHLQKTQNQLGSIKVYDAIGVVHTLSLDEIPFALQKKAAMAYPTLQILVEANEMEAAKIRLHSLVDLMVERSKSGLKDHDPRRRNFGFINNQAIEIDLGSYSIDHSLQKPDEQNRTLLKETIKLRRFTKKYIPQLLETLDEKIDHNLKINLDRGYD